MIPFVAAMAGGGGSSAVAGIALAVSRLGSESANAGKKINAMSGMLVGKLTAPLDLINGIAHSFSNLVQLANPTLVEVFTRTMNDAYAVLGGMLTPALKGLMIYGRMLGDVFAKLQPIMQPLFDAVGQSFASAAYGVGEMIQALAPFIQLVADGFVKAMRAASIGVAFVQGIVVELVNTIASLFGLTSRLDKGRNSRNAAVYSPKVSSVEEFARSQFEKQIQGMFGPQQGKDPIAVLPEIKNAVETGKIFLQQIKINVEHIWNWIQNRKEDLEDVGNILDMTPLGMLRKALIS